MVRAIDLNADLGEGFGAYRRGDDAELLRLVSSASVACGFHAGDPRTMDRAVALAAEAGASVGAHPGYPDRVGFGRRALACTPDEVETDVLYQLGALEGFCRRHSVRLRHLKPHGALYHAALRDVEIARAVVRAARQFDASLIILAPGRSALAEAAGEGGLRCAREGFLDRGYLPDGSLVPRGLPQALLADPADVARRARRLAAEGTVECVDGTLLPLACDSLCVHGDGQSALQALRAARVALTEAGVAIRPLAEILP